MADMWMSITLFCLSFPRFPGIVSCVEHGDLRCERGGSDPAGGGWHQTARHHGEAAGGRRRHRPACSFAEVDLDARRKGQADGPNKKKFIWVQLATAIQKECHKLKEVAVEAGSTAQKAIRFHMKHAVTSSAYIII